MYDLDDHQVGDEFEASPHELGQIISAILAEGGSFAYEGNSVVITSLPLRQIIDPVYEFEVPAPEPEAVPELVEEAAKPKGRPRKVVSSEELE